LRGLWINRRHSNDTTQDESSASSEEDGTSETEEKIKEKILRASLPFVPEHGWTKHAISEGLKWQTDNSCPIICNDVIHKITQTVILQEHRPLAILVLLMVYSQEEEQSSFSTSM
jgi:hypothetical protein